MALDWLDLLDKHERNIQELPVLGAQDISLHLMQQTALVTVGSPEVRRGCMTVGQLLVDIED